MDENSVTKYITGTFESVEYVVASGTFFFIGSERHFPFATLVNADEHDAFSNLDRPGVFRLNIGVSKATFVSLFGPSKEESTATPRDFTLLDQLMPHPVYGQMYWVSILNPTDDTFQSRVQPLLAEAYQMNAQKLARRTKGGD